MRGYTPSPTPSPAPSPVPGSVGSSNGDYPNQQRLKDVHKKYRIIEGTRRIYHGESEGILRRQEAALANIRTDNKSLRQIVDTYYIPNYEDQMAHLQEEATKYSELVDMEAKRLEELDIECERRELERLELKRVQGGANAALDRHRNALMHIQIVENRIHKAVVDLNIVERQNRSLKRKMEEIKEERELFDSVRMKLERELQWKEKEMEKCIELSSLMYDERNDIEERYTDLLEIHGDMEAYKFWVESKGWSVMEPEPVENFMHIQPKVDERKEPTEFSEYFRQWIDVKGIANIQDILDVNDLHGIVPGIKELQQRNAAVIELLKELVKEMDTIKACPKPFEVNIESVYRIDYDIRKKPDVEALLEKIFTYLRDINFDDEEYVIIINEMKRRIGNIFREAGCTVDDNDLTNEKGKARLEEHLGQWYTILDNFVDYLIREAIAEEASKKKS